MSSYTVSGESTWRPIVYTEKEVSLEMSRELPVIPYDPEKPSSIGYCPPLVIDNEFYQFDADGELDGSLPKMDAGITRQGQSGGSGVKCERVTINPDRENGEPPRYTNTSLVTLEMKQPIPDFAILMRKPCSCDSCPIPVNLPDGTRVAGVVGCNGTLTHLFDKGKKSLGYSLLRDSGFSVYGSGQSKTGMPYTVNGYNSNTQVDIPVRCLDDHITSGNNDSIPTAGPTKQCTVFFNENIKKDKTYRGANWGLVSDYSTQNKGLSGKNETNATASSFQIKDTITAVSSDMSEVQFGRFFSFSPPMLPQQVDQFNQYNITYLQTPQQGWPTLKEDESGNPSGEVAVLIDWPHLPDTCVLIVASASKKVLWMRDALGGKSVHRTEWIKARPFVVAESAPSTNTMLTSEFSKHDSNQTIGVVWDIHDLWIENSIELTLTIYILESQLKNRLAACSHSVSRDAVIEGTPWPGWVCPTEAQYASYDIIQYASNYKWPTWNDYVWLWSKSQDTMSGVSFDFYQGITFDFRDWSGETCYGGDAPYADYAGIWFILYIQVPAKEQIKGQALQYDKEKLCTVCYAKSSFSDASWSLLNKDGNMVTQKWDKYGINAPDLYGSMTFKEGAVIFSSYESKFQNELAGLKSFSWNLWEHLSYDKKFKDLLSIEMVAGALSMTISSQMWLSKGVALFASTRVYSLDMEDVRPATCEKRKTKEPE